VSAKLPQTGLIEAASVVTLGVLIVSVPVTLEPLTVAVSTALVFVATAVVVTVTEPVVAPAAIVTVAGDVIDVVPEDRPTDKPPAGAGPLRVTVAWLLAPPITLVGENVTVLAVGGVTVSVPFAELLASAALIVAVALAATAVVVTVNVPVVAPAAITTVAGTTADALFDVRLRVSPPVGAGAAMVTVAVEDVPPTTDAGFNVTLVTPVVVIVRFAL